MTTTELDIEAFYGRYGPMVYRRCLSLLRDAPAAEDAMQDVYVELVKRRSQLATTTPSSLLYRIATNVCLNRARAARVRGEGHSEAKGDNALLAIIAADDPERRVGAQWMLDRLFGREPASTKAMAVSHFVDGMTLEEVAQEFGMSVSGVRHRLRRLKLNAPGGDR